jgi:hypothetical protein
LPAIEAPQTYRPDARRFGTVARAELRSTIDPDTHLGCFRDAKKHIFWLV